MNSGARVLFASVLLFGSLQQCQVKQTSIATISVREVYDIINDSTKVDRYVVLDTRDRMDYVRGHLVSAFWLSPDSIDSKINLIMNEKRPFIIYDSAGNGSDIANILASKGVGKFFVMDGGFSEWSRRGYPAAIQLVRNTTHSIMSQRKDVSTDEVHELFIRRQLECVVLDIRSSPEFIGGHIKGALSIPYLPINEFVVAVEEHNFPRSKPIVIYCDRQSDVGENAAEVMLRNDFLNVYLVKGGIEEWSLKNFPMEYGI